MKKSKSAQRNEINGIIRTTTSGLHHDEFWAPINRAFALIREAGYDVDLTETHYSKDEVGNPVSKTWSFTIPTTTKNPFYGTITASAAGSCSDPLSHYDVVGYVS